MQKTRTEGVRPLFPVAASSHMPSMPTAPGRPPHDLRRGVHLVCPTGGTLAGARQPLAPLARARPTPTTVPARPYVVQGVASAAAVPTSEVPQFAQTSAANRACGFRTQSSHFMQDVDPTTGQDRLASQTHPVPSLVQELFGAPSFFSDTLLQQTTAANAPSSFAPSVHCASPVVAPAGHSTWAPLGPSREAFTQGSRIEAFYENQWYVGVVVDVPENDPRGLGLWTVQCDVDDAGVVAYVEQIRPSTEAPPVATDGSNVVISKVLSRENGYEYFVVIDAHGRQLGSFCEEHILFQMHIDVSLLRHWLDTLDTPVLPGLLALLVEDMQACGTKVKGAQERLRSLHAPEDYLFFGLTEHCSDQELVRAYRRMSARLHPDKGGDEGSFSAMRQRYDRLRRLRSHIRTQNASEPQVDHRDNVEEHADGNAPVIEPMDSEYFGDQQDEYAASNNYDIEGAIAWDPRDRSSMLAAHGHLLSQVSQGRAQIDAIEREIEELLISHNTIHCLSDGIIVHSQTGIGNTGVEGGTGRFVPAAVATHATGASHQNGIDSCPEYPAARERLFSMGNCMICLERLPAADPRAVVNLCHPQSEPRCSCLLHLRCFLDPLRDMNDHFRRCMICKGPADPDLVHMAERARD